MRIRLVCHLQPRGQQSYCTPRLVYWCFLQAKQYKIATNVMYTFVPRCLPCDTIDDVGIQNSHRSGDKFVEKLGGAVENVNP